MTIPNDKTTLNFVLDRVLKDKLQILATEDNRKLGNYVAHQLEQFMIEYELGLMETYGFNRFHAIHQEIFGELKIHLFERELEPEQKKLLNSMLDEADDSLIDPDKMSDELKRFIMRNSKRVWKKEPSSDS